MFTSPVSNKTDADAISVSYSGVGPHSVPAATLIGTTLAANAETEEKRNILFKKWHRRACSHEMEILRCYDGLCYVFKS